MIMLGISCLFHVKFSIILFYVEKKSHMVYTVEPNEYFHSALVDSTKGFSKYNYSLCENYLAKLVFLGLSVEYNHPFCSILICYGSEYYQYDSEKFLICANPTSIFLLI